MKKITFLLLGVVVLLLLVIVVVKNQNAATLNATEGGNHSYTIPEKKSPEVPQAQFVAMPLPTTIADTEATIDVHPIPDYLEKSIIWLAQTQAPNGGWGATQHGISRGIDRDIRRGIDIEECKREPAPQVFKTNPATTAFCAIALVRSGSNLEKGEFQTQVRKALDYLLDCVAATPDNATNITTEQGTQPQRKLGQNIDVSMAIQFFGKILHEGVKDKDLEMQINTAIDRCIAMLGKTQKKDGSWNTAGWAPVLNSAMANNALEMSQTLDRDVEDILEQSRAYQRSNIDSGSGTVKTGRSAGIALYSVTSTQRATAKDANEAATVFKAKKAANPENTMPESETEAFDILRENYSEEKAKQLASSYRANVAAKQQLKNDAVLSGFGNNGGEEYLSYMMTSESFVAEGDQKSWDDWHTKMGQLFEKVQNGDGSWTGQHCITSAAFCTAAVVMTLTADRDAEILMAKK